MQRWNRVCSALALVFLAGCTCCEPAAPADEVAIVALEGGSSRLAALEASMARIAAKRIWSAHYFEGSMATGARVDGPDLFVTVFNPATRNHELHCYDVAKGTPRWLVAVGPAPFKHAPAGGDRFVVCLLDQGAGMVVVNRRTGSREFRVTAPIKVLPGGAAGSSDSSVYLASLVDNRLHAVDPDTGMSGWTWRAEGTLVGGPAVTPRLPRRLVVVGTDLGEVHALPAAGWDEVAPGAPTWSRKLLGDISAELAVASHLTPGGHEVSILVPCEDKSLHCLDASTGDARWILRTSAPFRSSPQAAGGRVFARNLERLVVADLATGKQPWGGGDAEAPKGFECCTGVYASDAKRAYLICDGKRVCRADGRTGEITATASLDDFDMLVPAGDHNLLLGMTRDGCIVAFE